MKKLLSLILGIIGGVISYFSVFHNAFGNFSGFLAVIGGILVTICVVIFFSGNSENERAINRALDRAERRIDQVDIDRLNNMWNNAQRNYERYNYTDKDNK